MKILITGDFCPIGRATNKSAEQVFGEETLELINSADLAITNLECPLTNSEQKISKSGPNLKVEPFSINLLKGAGFNFVTLANNHILDYGCEGLIDTLDVLNSNEIGYVGAGKVDDDISTQYFKFLKKTLAIINVCENEWSTEPNLGYKAYGLDEIEMYNQITKLKNEVDYILVVHHGGNEFYNLPAPRLKKLFRFFVDIGADAVINHHTHCISGMEIYKNSPIFYSLGNFVFDNQNYESTDWNFGLGIMLNFNDAKLSYETYVFEQFGKEAKVDLLGSKHEYHQKILDLNKKVQDDKKLDESYKAFIKNKSKLYNS
ncbi:CapA family protein [Mesonia sp.]|uniref:CapA family protein n=1 Tax=Mesonia sp. TaxID=1960830 RepID=UPI001763EE2F|nr:CapA family protein [Mesonia sp.]HIB38456.1 CapA family protein [Mesonia sp.]